MRPEWLGPGGPDAGGEPVSERVAAGREPGVDGPAELAVLRRLEVQAPAHFDHLAVHGDHPPGLVYLPDGKRGQLTPPQPAVGGRMSHELIPRAAPPGAKRPPEPGDVAAGRDLGRIDPQRRFPREADRGRGHRPVPGLPVHLGQPRVGEVAAVQARADQGRDHPPDPVALARRGCGVDDRLRVGDGDVLAGDRADNRDGEPRAQSALGVRVPARPLPFSRQPVGIEVPGDQVRAGPPHLRRTGRQPLGDPLEFAGQPVLGHRLALPPLASPPAGSGAAPPRAAGRPRRRPPRWPASEGTGWRPGPEPGTPAGASARRRRSGRA